MAFELSLLWEVLSSTLKLAPMGLAPICPPSSFWPSSESIPNSVWGHPLGADRQLLSVPKSLLFWAYFVDPHSLMALFSWRVSVGGSGMEWSFPVGSQLPEPEAPVGSACLCGMRDLTLGSLEAPVPQG